MSYESYWDWLPKEIQGEIVKWSYYPDAKKIALHREFRDKVEKFPEKLNHWRNGWGSYRLLNNKLGPWEKFGYRDWCWAFTGRTIDEELREQKKPE